ncbi:hypothetical protein L861_06280 [Litchfieldella anticariensis FP35 = DSM 16096]|uniref:Lysine transporter LysE n=1 Tax=Litchfieldella anticariensis (strain DSM 16096 / CECT 5854 / CIP 108499 / LMG 22089 / FP35) TaxID=1121939 RepID=S2KF63_LITA3|nr:LysE family translocator [Halomonas anticariensis]EPC00545.1 hypothetical protein L861_06280 [Halomonas anticariensis FP35 = DSM 16096]
MLDIFLYAVGIMYTPGPVNLLSLNAGLQNRFRQTFGFFGGVALAMLVLFLVFGYTGEAIVKPDYLPYVALAGASFIAYLAIKLFRAQVDTNGGHSQGILTFKDGFLMQLLNPKGTLATLLIATLQFPAQGITGLAILAMSIFLSLLAFGAPCSYSLLGAVAGRWITNPRLFVHFNRIMALLLIYVAGTILYEQVIRKLVA